MSAVQTSAPPMCRLDVETGRGSPLTGDGESLEAHLTNRARLLRNSSWLAHSRWEGNQVLVCETINENLSYSNCRLQANVHQFFPLEIEIAILMENDKWIQMVLVSHNNKKGRGSFKIIGHNNFIQFHGESYVNICHIFHHAFQNLAHFHSVFMRSSWVFHGYSMEFPITNLQSFGGEPRNACAACGPSELMQELLPGSTGGRTLVCWGWNEIENPYKMIGLRKILTWNHQFSHEIYRIVLQVFS